MDPFPSSSNKENLENHHDLRDSSISSRQHQHHRRKRQCKKRQRKSSLRRRRADRKRVARRSDSDHRRSSGRGAIDWAAHLIRERGKREEYSVDTKNQVTEEEEEERRTVNMMRRITNGAEAYGQCERRVQTGMGKYFPTDAKEKGTLCAVELWLGDVRGTLRDDGVDDVFVCLCAGAVWCPTSFLSCEDEARVHSLVTIVGIAWMTVCASLGHGRKMIPSRYREGLEIGRQFLSTVATKRSAPALVRALDVVRGCCAKDERRAERLTRAFSVSVETLSIQYNATYRLRERRERQPIEDWLLVGIPGPEKAMNAFEYETRRGRRYGWIKTVLPNGGYVYKRPPVRSIAN